MVMGGGIVIVYGGSGERAKLVRVLKYLAVLALFRREVVLVGEV